MANYTSELNSSVLKEIGNIGAGHAATALAELMGITVGLTEPDVNTLPIDHKVMHSASEERESAVLHMSVLGDAPADMIIIFDREEAAGFVKRFLEKQIGAVDIGEEVIDSGLREIANIIGGAYLTAIIDMTNIELLPSTPKLVYGHLKEILATIINENEPTSGCDAFIINNGFINERGAINAEFLLIPHDGTLESYLHAFGVGD